MISISIPSYPDTAEDQPNLWVYATGRQEEEDGKSLVRDERDKAITCVICRDLH